MRLLIGLISFGLSFLAIVTPALAEKKLVSWTYFSPSALMVSLRPGETATGTIRLENLMTTAQTVTSRTADLTIAHNGQLMVSPFQTSRIVLGQTLVLDQSTLTLAPQAEQRLAYRLTMPAETALGDYLGVVIFHFPNNQPRLELGIPILVRVTADPPAAGLTVRHDIDIPPFQPQITQNLPINLLPTSPAAEGIKLTELRLAPWSLFSIRTQGEIMNTNSTTARADVLINYKNPGGATIATDQVTMPFLAPGGRQSFTISKTTLWRETTWGKLPYLGPLVISASLPGQTGALVAETVILPWWALILLLASSTALILRLAAIHPFFPHRPVRYQGRVALMILLFLASSVSLPVVTKADQLSPTESINVTASVALYGRYRVYEEEGQLVVETQSNYYLQLITESGTYLIKPGDPPLRLPLGSSILILGMFGVIES